MHVHVHVHVGNFLIVNITFMVCVFVCVCKLIQLKSYCVMFTMVSNCVKCVLTNIYIYTCTGIMYIITDM